MEKENFYDVVVIGGGPAGLTAALYLARARYRVLILEKEKFGGQVTITDEVVNYPGIEKTSGRALTETMRRQAEFFGAEFLLREVTALKKEETASGAELWESTTDKDSFQSFGILLATGAHPRMIGFPGEAEFRGHGVAYCATCDGEFFYGKEIFVIGGGFAAAEESVFLTKFASHVTILIRDDDFSCAKAVAEAAKNHPKITVLTNTEVICVEGDHMLRRICYRNRNTGKETLFDSANDTFGVFVFAGYEPATEIFKNQVELNNYGNLIVDQNQKTNLDGVYGAGDVCVKELRQVVTAVSDGATAATSLEKYIPNIVTALKLSPKKIKIKEAVQTSKETSENDDSFITPKIKQQLAPIFAKLEKQLIIKCSLDHSKLAGEIKSFIEEFTTLSDKLSYQFEESNSSPAMRFYDENNNYLNISYHAVPGGHEFNSFVIAIYNAVGPKQPLDTQIINEIKQINKPTNIKVVVSLSCTMCPDVVMASQRIAIENNNVDAHVFDLAHFPELKEQYQIMSVPCMIINDQDVYFGKKDIQQVIEIIKK